MGAAAALSLRPATLDALLEALVSSGAAGLLVDELGRASIGPAAAAMLIFANNFLVVAVMVVGLSRFVPALGILAGLALAVPLGAGLAISGEAAGLQRLAVAPVLLLEQQAVVLGMLCAWRTQRGRRRPDRGKQADPRGAESMERSGGVGRSLLAMAVLLFVAALYEAALLFSHA